MSKSFHAIVPLKHHLLAVKYMYLIFGEKPFDMTLEPLLPSFSAPRWDGLQEPTPSSANSCYTLKLHPRFFINTGQIVLMDTWRTQVKRPKGDRTVWGHCPSFNGDGRPIRNHPRTCHRNLRNLCSTSPQNFRNQPRNLYIELAKRWQRQRQPVLETICSQLGPSEKPSMVPGLVRLVHLVRLVRLVCLFLLPLLLALLAGLFQQTSWLLRHVDDRTT